MEDPTKTTEKSLIAILQDIQNKYSYLPNTELNNISTNYGIALSEIYGTATFYSQFKFNKPGKNIIKVCHGTACHINGAVSLSDTLEDILKIKPGETDEKGIFSIEDVACLGCCSLAPVIMINNKVYGNLTNKKLKTIINKLKKETEETNEQL